MGFNPVVVFELKIVAALVGSSATEATKESTTALTTVSVSISTSESGVTSKSEFLINIHSEFVLSIVRRSKIEFQRKVRDVRGCVKLKAWSQKTKKGRNFHLFQLLLYVLNLKTWHTTIPIPII